MRVLTFAVMVVALAVVSPFSPDYGMDVLFNEAAHVDTIMTASVTPLSTVDEFWNWTSGAFLGGSVGTSIVSPSPNGNGLLVFDRELVGPIVFTLVRRRATRVLHVALHAMYADVGHPA